jgi:hypothetical protein
MSAKRAREPRRPSVVRGNIPTSLDDLCVALLRRRAADRPTAEAIEAALAGAHGAPSPRKPFPSVAPFVGRASELERLHAAFDESLRRPVFAVVEGDSGLGKTSLLERFFTDLAIKAPDALVLRSRCYERELVPFKAFDGAIDGLAAHLSGRRRSEVTRIVPAADSRVLLRTFPVLGRAVPATSELLSERTLDPVEFRRRAFVALAEAFARVVEERPLALAIDDLQWQDDDSRALLQFLRWGGLAPRMLIVAAARHVDAELLEGATHIPLAGLAADDATTLLRTMGPGLDEASIESLLAEGAGHPMFLQELARAPALAAQGRARVLDEALSSRAFAQEPDARRLLEVVCVSGAPIGLEAARRAADLSKEGVAKARLDLAGARLLRRSTRAEDELECYHDRVRESVVARLGAQAVAGHHLRIGEALDAIGADDPARLQRHFEAAGEGERAAKWAEEAGLRAESKLAFDRAAASYEAALRLGRHPEERAIDLRRRLAAALANAGRGAEAAKEYLALVPTSRDDADRLDLRRRAADGLLLSGRIDEGMVPLRQVLAAVGVSYPRYPWLALVLFLVTRLRLSRRLRIRPGGVEADESTAPTEAELLRLDACFAVARLLAMVDMIRGAYFQALAIHYALKLGEPARLANALSLEACYEAVVGPRSRPKVEFLLASARTLAAKSRDRKAIALADAGRSLTMFLEGSYYDALEPIQRSIRSLRECVDSVWELRTLEEFNVWARAFVGRPRELRAAVETQVREAADRNDVFLGANMRAGITAFAWLVDDDVAKARAMAREGGELWKESGYQIQHHRTIVGHALIDLYEEKGAEAFARIDAIRGQFLGALFLRVRVLWIEAQIMWARVALAKAAGLPTAERAPLLRIAGKVLRRMRGDPLSLAQVGGPLVEAGLHELSGRTTEANDALRRTIAAGDAHHFEGYAATARWLLAGRVEGAERAALAAAAEEWIAAQRIRDVRRFSAMLAPGVTRPAA